MIRDAVCLLRSQQHNIERWGGEDGNWISEKKKKNYVQVSQLFLSQDCSKKTGVHAKIHYDVTSVLDIR